MAEKKKFNATLAENRKARHDFTVLETIECGIVLSGTEAKSCRCGGVSLSGSYGAVLRGELWLGGADIAGYKFGDYIKYTGLLEVIIAISVVMLVPLFFPL